MSLSFLTLWDVWVAEPVVSVSQGSLVLIGPLGGSWCAVASEMFATHAGLNLLTD